MTQAVPRLSYDHISVNALKVVSRLADAGYQAYLVGGCVRDLMLEKFPKDFDVATDAHPEEVHALFRNSRMIGKRFRIVHVRFGQEIVEVATFRAQHSASTHEENYSEGGMILSDNVFGSFEEDVYRRDFTMNALYYDPESDSLIDLVGGVADVEARRIRLIGDPENRYREDPVRMLRAIRFRANLGFDFDPATGQPLRQLGFLLQDIPAARLFEEVLKLFMSGYGLRSYELMMEFGLFGWMFPDTRRTMDDFPGDKLVRSALASTDKRIATDLPVTPAFIFAAFLWYPFVEEKQNLEKEGMSASTASHEASGNVIARQQLFTSIPKRFTGMMRDMWNLQFRLPIRHGRRAENLSSNRRFRAAYDFLLLRAESGENLN
ncbi:MAG: polynucleotide adenylyltransferase PcnB, partial [Pseudomonadales bacterium]|nr:polynucleotide adenylyltransferase PcnB [Pseudomonadales bacterium]